jgi:hypothetical protein
MTLKHVNVGLNVSRRKFFQFKSCAREKDVYDSIYEFTNLIIQSLTKFNTCKVSVYIQIIHLI